MGEGRDADFALKEGEDVGGLDIAPISTAVEGALAGGGFERVADVVDVYRLSAMLAAEWFIGNADGYGSFSNNFRLYVPSSGRAVLAPWDMGSTFPEEGRDEALWDRPDGNLAALCFADPGCAADQEGRREALPLAVEADGLPDMLRVVRDRVRLAAEGDPVGFCDAARVTVAQEGILAWFER